MDIIPEDEVHRYKRDSKYNKKFIENVLPKIREYTKTEPYTMAVSEKTIRELLDVDKDTSLESIYKRLKIITSDTNIGISFKDHVIGSKAIIFYDKR